MIEAYIEDQKLAWSPTTLRSEKYRLRGVSEALDGNPPSLWSLLDAKRAGRYARLTTWTRVTAYWQWMIDHGHKEGPNPYEAFRRKNARLFKHVYQPNHPKISFEEAVAKLKLLEGSDRALALQILASGERFSESIQPSGRVVGKGNKSRHTYRPSTASQPYERSYASFRRALRSVGLKPHDLRKLCASRLVANGATERDLMEAMGWASLAPAHIYLIPKRQEEMKKLFDGVQEAL